MSKRKLTDKFGLPWGKMQEALDASIALRMPVGSGPRVAAAERDYTLSDPILDFASKLRVTSDGEVVDVVLHKVQKQAVEDWYSQVLDDGSGEPYVTLGALCMPKRNGKSLLCAVLALAHLIGPKAKRKGNLVFVAQSIDQAKIMMEYVRDIIDSTTWIDEDALGLEYKYNAGRPSITCGLNGSVLHIVASTLKAVSGLTIDFFVIDEYSLHKDETVLHMLRKSQQSLRRPFGLVISTMSHYPGNPMANLLERGKRIEDGTEAANGFHLIFLGLRKGEDWLAPEVWRRVNPGMPYFPKEWQFRQEAEEARHNPFAKMLFIIYNLNGETTTLEQLFDMAHWEACKDPELRIEQFKGEECFGGLDLSKSDDMTAFTLWFPESRAVFCWSWLPSKQVVALTAQHHIPYTDYVDRKALYECGEEALNYDEVAETIAHICAEHEVRTIGYDRKFWERFEISALRAGLDLPPMVEFVQNFGGYAPAVNKLEELILNEDLQHAGNPVLDLSIKYTGFKVGTWGDNARMPAPLKGSTVKIDPTSASLMAIGTALRVREPIETDWSAYID